jgi:hypothetical protein
MALSRKIRVNFTILWNYNKILVQMKKVRYRTQSNLVRHICLQWIVIYSRHYLQQTTYLHARKNTNRFCYACLTGNLSDTAKVHTFLRVSMRYIQPFKNVSVFTKILTCFTKKKHKTFTALSQTDSSLLESELHVLPIENCIYWLRYRHGRY